MGAVVLLLALVLVLVLDVPAVREAPTPEAPPSAGPVIRVLDTEGNPVRGGRVEFFRRSRYTLIPGPLPGGTTDEDGLCALPGNLSSSSPAGELLAVVRAGDAAAEAFTIDASGLGASGAVEEIRLSPGLFVGGVVLGLRGRPISGARVLYPQELPPILETRTDRKGRFRLGPVPEDAWLRAEAEGHAPLDLNLALYPTPDSEIVFYLVDGRRVAGRVVDSRGVGIPDAVLVLDQEARSRFGADAEGRFTLRGVLSDWEVLVEAHAEGRIGEIGTATAGQDDFVIPLYRPAEASGTVWDGRTEEPVGEFEVVRQDAEVAPPNRFRIPDLLPGELELEIRSGGRVGRARLEISEGDVRRDLRIALYPERWGPPEDFAAPVSVALRIVEPENGKPLAGVRVRGSGPRQEARTDSAGRVELAFPPGIHHLTLGGAFEPHAREDLFLSVPEDGDPTVELQRNRLAILELEGGRAERDSKLWLHQGGEVKEVEVGGRGLEFFAPRDEPFDILLKAKGCEPVTLRGIELPEDGRIRVALRKGASIRGRCLGAGGYPLPKVVAEVQEKPLDARMETLGDGRFSVGPLDPGTYSLLIYARNVRARRLEVEVGPDGADVGDVDLLPPGTIQVQVMTSDRRPVPGAVVETSVLVGAKAVTDLDGRVDLPGKNPEETVRASAAGFLDAWAELRLPDDLEVVRAVLTMFRPARLVVRTVDTNGRLVAALAPSEVEIEERGVGEFIVSRLPPGPVDLEFTDREGRTGRLQTLIREGEERMEVVILR